MPPGDILRCEPTSPDHAPRGAFLEVWPTVARRRSVRLDRCEVTRCATRLGLICLCGGSAGAPAPGAPGPAAQARRDRSGQAPPPGNPPALVAEARRIIRLTPGHLYPAL